MTRGGQFGLVSAGKRPVRNRWRRCQRRHPRDGVTGYSSRTTPLGSWGRGKLTANAGSAHWHERCRDDPAQGSVGDYTSWWVPEARRGSVGTIQALTTAV
jgi:hypothetical protein